MVNCEIITDDEFYKFTYSKVIEELNKVWFFCWAYCYDEYIMDADMYNERVKVFLNYKTKKNPYGCNYIIRSFFYSMRNQQEIFEDIIYKHIKRETRKFNKRNDPGYDHTDYDKCDSAYDFDSNDSENFYSDDSEDSYAY